MGSLSCQFHQYIFVAVPCEHNFSNQCLLCSIMKIGRVLKEITEIIIHRICAEDPPASLFETILLQKEHLSLEKFSKAFGKNMEQMVDVLVERQGCDSNSRYVHNKVLYT